MAGERRRIIKETAALLQGSQTVRDPNVRLMLLHELDVALEEPLQLREVSLPRTQLVQLVTACVEQNGGLRSLAECVDLLEPDAYRAHALLRLADEWQIFEQFAAHDLLWLRADLTGIRLTGDLRGFVAEHHVEPVPGYCESAWHVFAHLASVPPGGGHPAWLRLLDRLTSHVPAGSRTRLQNLVRELSEVWGGLPPSTAGTHPDTGDGTAYLVFQFEKYGADDETYIMTYWRQWASPVWQPTPGEPRHVRRDDLEAAVDRVVLETERQWADRQGPVMIEFVLPAQLLGMPIDQWRWELGTPMPRRLALHYPLVIRSLERIRANQWHRAWRGRWRTLTEVTAEHRVVRCAVAGQADVQLEATLERDRSAVVLVLSEPPLPDSEGERQLLVGIRTGLPAIVWNRNSGSSPKELCDVVSSLVDAGWESARGVAMLPHGVAELRRVAWHKDPQASGEQIGHGLVILWDDPERQPAHHGPNGSDTGEVCS